MSRKSAQRAADSGTVSPLLDQRFCRWSRFGRDAAAPIEACYMASDSVAGPASVEMRQRQ